VAGADDASRIGIGRELPGWRFRPFKGQPQLGQGQVGDTGQREPGQRDVPAVEGQISICAPAHRHPPPVLHFVDLEWCGLAINGDGHILPGQLVTLSRRLESHHVPGDGKLTGLVITVLPQHCPDSVLGYPPPQSPKVVVLLAVRGDGDGHAPVAVVHPTDMSATSSLPRSDRPIPEDEPT
jgi:hypothetical protein